ncbi:DinB family protein [Rhodohalobacter sp. SW132]|uniref:DinB family protein n=1 Tax=Rhodohalobacter sp. SW132 TaxID=2293433 RepID=UPI000E2426F2|nr:DinB family protein [Rhodohalobacter sp. SW132]REL37811.1 DinB family protein [Rhodohalobacter sp. SW132]
MTILEMFTKELKSEAEITRKFLQSVPEDKMEWQPHSKSMTLKRLINHVAELPEWIEGVIQTRELDFEKEPYTPNDRSSRDELIAFFEDCLKRGLAALGASDESMLSEMWTLRAGEVIFSETEKWEMIRHTLNQITHHRAQLGVYYRLLDIPVPSSYGGSADDDSF